MYTTTEKTTKRVPSGWWDCLLNCASESAKYKTRAEFKKHSGCSLRKARQNNWLDAICEHMQPKLKATGHWQIKENAIAAARKFKTRADFALGESGAWRACSNNGWLGEAQSHMELIEGRWQIKENCLAEAKKYTSRKDFEFGCSSAWNACYQNGWLEEAQSHMERIKGKWNNKHLCMLEAIKYHKRTYFQKSSVGAYEAAARNGWLNEICSHMPPVKTGFNYDKPAILYHLMVKKYGQTAFKVGVTNKTVHERYNKNDLIKITILKTEHFDFGIDAFNKEQTILKEFKAFKWAGEDLLQNGNTELLTIDTTK